MLPQLLSLALVLAFCTANAQNADDVVWSSLLQRPPVTSGGGSSNWPSGLIADWNADSVSGSTGDSVTSWTDSVGSVTASVGASGIWLTNSALNGHKLLAFSGSAYLNHTLSVTGAQTFAIFMRHTVSADSWNCPFIAIGPNAAPGLIFFSQNYSTVYAGCLMSGWKDSTLDLRNTNSTVIVTSDGNTGNCTNRIYLNGSAQTFTDTSNVASQSFDRRSIGIYAPSVAGLFKGSIARILVFNRELSSSEVADVRTYLDATYR